MFEPLWQATDTCALGGAESIALTDAVGEKKKLSRVEVKWTAGVAPTTSENLVIKLDSGLGATYDKTLKSINPSSYCGGVHEYVWTPEPDMGELLLTPSDHINVTYTNTDDLAITAAITFEPR